MKRSLVVAFSGVSVVLLLLAGGMSRVAVADGNTELGTWKLNVAKSKYDPGPAPKGGTRKYEPFEGDGFNLMIELVNADGSRTTNTGSGHYDGKDYPAKDSQNRWDTMTRKRIDAHTTEAVQKKAGRVVQTIRNVVSKDGKTMTSTTKGTNTSGPYTNVQVFDKQ
jgi:hypothetical protein